MTTTAPMRRAASKFGRSGQIGGRLDGDDVAALRLGGQNRLDGHGSLLEA